MSTLIKTTAVVSYVAVADMVSVFESIRRESFEILLPLLCTTVVYFVMIKLITAVIRRFPLKGMQRRTGER